MLSADLCKSFYFFCRSHADWLFHQHVQPCLCYVNLHCFCSNVQRSCKRLQHRLVSRQPENATPVPDQNKRHLVSSSTQGCPSVVALTMHCRRNPNDHPFRLCCRLQHALMVFESLAAFPFFGIRSLLVLLDAFLCSLNQALVIVQLQSSWMSHWCSV